MKCLESKICVVSWNSLMTLMSIVMVGMAIYSKWSEIECHRTDRLCREACYIARGESTGLDIVQMHNLIKNLGLYYRPDFNQEYEFYSGIFGVNFVIRNDDGEIEFADRIGRKSLERYISEHKSFAKQKIVI